MTKLGFGVFALIGLSLAGASVAAPPADEPEAAITITAERPKVSSAELPAALAGARIDVRRYVHPAQAAHAVRAALRQPETRLIADDDLASGHEIGRPCEVVRRVRVVGPEGMTVFIVTRSEPVWPFRAEVASVAVDSLPRALRAVEGEGGAIVARPFTAGDQEVAVVQTRDGRLFEIHAPRRPGLTKLQRRFGQTRPYEPVNTDRPALTAVSTAASQCAAQRRMASIAD